MAFQDSKLIVVSSDKDLMQLVAHNVRLFDSAKDHWIGTAEVIAKFGVQPCGVTDVLGLMGDAADNIPGIKGIGEKTAMVLTRRFGSLENLFDNLDNLDASGLRGVNRLRKLLLEGKMRHSAPHSCHYKEGRADYSHFRTDEVRGPDHGKLRKLFVELEFSNLLELLDHRSELTHNLSRMGSMPAVEDAVGFQLELFLGNDSKLCQMILAEEPSRRIRAKMIIAR